MILESVLYKRNNCLLIWDHSCDNCLFLLRAKMVKLWDNFIAIFVKMLDFFDASCVDVSELYAIPLHCKDMVVEPLSFNKQHLQLFSLFVVESLLNNLALIDFADLMLAAKWSCLLRHLYLALLLIWALKSIVYLLHQFYLLMCFTYFIYSWDDENWRQYEIFCAIYMLS